MRTMIFATMISLISKNGCLRSHLICQAFVPFSKRPFSHSKSAMLSSPNDAQVVQDMLYRIRQVNYMPEDIRASLLDFVVDGRKVGKVRHARRESRAPSISWICCRTNTQLKCSSSFHHRRFDQK